MIMDLTKLIDWKDAPDWANFAVFDSEWNLWWFEHQPGATVFGGWSSPYKNSRCVLGKLTKRPWTETLQRRPI